MQFAHKQIIAGKNRIFHGRGRHYKRFHRRPPDEGGYHNGKHKRIAPLLEKGPGFLFLLFPVLSQEIPFHKIDRF
jgi:hypothetical protein